jgi:acyl carrier protein
MTEDARIRERIRTFIAEVFFVDGFDDEQSLLRTGLLDSMGMSQLVAFLEQEFALEVRDEELVPENLDSVSRAAAFVARKRGRPAA